jgi:hypothetical protein
MSRKIASGIGIVISTVFSATSRGELQPVAARAAT